MDFAFSERKQLVEGLEIQETTNRVEDLKEIREEGLQGSSFYMPFLGLTIRITWGAFKNIDIWASFPQTLIDLSGFEFRRYSIDESSPEQVEVSPFSI
jgi:hypothetical protein